MATVVPGFNNLPLEQKLVTALCPTSAQAVKITNKYISILFKARQNIDSGIHISNLTFPPIVDPYSWDSLNTTGESDLDVSSSECMSPFTSESE